MKETTNHKYRVIVADNFHYMDESEHYTLGEFNTLETAIAACRKIVDDNLGHLSLSKPGMTAKELYDLYIFFGDDPFVVVPPGEPASTFNAWHYAKRRAYEMCGTPLPAPDPPPPASSTPSISSPVTPTPSQTESKTSPPRSEEWWKAAIKLASRIAEQEARRMLALKTQKVWSKMGKSGPPPDMWSRLEEAERYQRPPRGR